MVQESPCVSDEFMTGTNFYRDVIGLSCNRFALLPVQAVGVCRAECQLSWQTGCLPGSGRFG